ncbi:hypothetical protein J7K24_01510 [bacterium]|nr:hypothetical protein [bacterium]
MNEEILEKLKEQDKKLDAIYHSVEKTRRYFLWTFIITIAMIILPLIGLIILLPRVLDIYTGLLGM